MMVNNCLAMNHGAAALLRAMVIQVKSGVSGLLIIGQVATLGSNLVCSKPKQLMFRTPA